mmetsp:Transcript_9868/g.17786  ORF Transcript_9868/g.17786 Transcript_9868/m.17786 type:complete len:240 (-) Transcript_9868:26-745(-)
MQQRQLLCEQTLLLHPQSSSPTPFLQGASSSLQAPCGASLQCLAQSATFALRYSEDARSPWQRTTHQYPKVSQPLHTLSLPASQPPSSHQEACPLLPSSELRVLLGAAVRAQPNALLQPAAFLLPLQLMPQRLQLKPQPQQLRLPVPCASSLPQPSWPLPPSSSALPPASTAQLQQQRVPQPLLYVYAALLPSTTGLHLSQPETLHHQRIHALQSSRTVADQWLPRKALSPLRRYRIPA